MPVYRCVFARPRQPVLEDDVKPVTGIDADDRQPVIRTEGPQRQCLPAKAGKPRRPLGSHEAERNVAAGMPLGRRRELQPAGRMTIPDRRRRHRT